MFLGTELIVRSELTEVVLQGKALFDRDDGNRIAVYDDVTGNSIDIDFTGSDSDVLNRLASHPIVGQDQSDHKRKPGRSKLGVVPREISLLPRHWSWLSTQRGGASATLRRLVDAARKNGAGEDQVRKAIDAAHRFMWDIAGDQPDFEEASRALFAQDFDRFSQLISSWPQGIIEQLHRFTERAPKANSNDLLQG